MNSQLKPCRRGKRVGRVARFRLGRRVKGDAQPWHLPQSVGQCGFRSHGTCVLTWLQKNCNKIIVADLCSSSSVIMYTCVRTSLSAARVILQGAHKMNRLSGIFVIAVMFGLTTTTTADDGHQNRCLKRS